MSDLLTLLVVVLLIGWALGLFPFSVAAIIHILLVSAIISILFRVVRGERI